MVFDQHKSNNKCNYICCSFSLRNIICMYTQPMWLFLIHEKHQPSRANHVFTVVGCMYKINYSTVVPTVVHRATSILISLVGTLPWKEESRGTSQTMVDTVNEDIGMANTGEQRILMQDCEEWGVCCHARQKSKEGVSESNINWQMAALKYIFCISVKVGIFCYKIYQGMLLCVVYAV